ncbi:MAG: transcription elongation factor Spt5 [Thermoplasmata archaeon]|nr:transcription elongation factor Spt5 [Thermoplasmata archaeon]RLF73676.1 MAG: transcription elongation factor Spt5 [Thermoplasmata archaeon]HDD60142.1 transcription elongation factor Spt5 [Euryarchaeota archaeon]
MSEDVDLFTDVGEERKEEKGEEEEVIFPETIFAIKTALGHEKTVADALSRRVRRKKYPIYAILSPPKLRGYVLVEGVLNTKAIESLIRGMEYVRGIIEGEASLEEIEHFLEPAAAVSGIGEGDIVEIIAGPFKGEKARVQRIDEAREEITVELFEAMVSIPVTLKGDQVRVLEKESRE